MKKQMRLFSKSYMDILLLFIILIDIYNIIDYTKCSNKQGGLCNG